MNNELLKEPSSTMMQEDIDFANQVLEYYKLPFEELCMHIRSFRNAATYNFPEVWEVDFTSGSTQTPDIKRIKKLLETWLYTLDDKVKEITITTSRGTVTIDHPDLIKMYFNYSVKGLKAEYASYLASEVDEFRTWIMDGHIAVLHYFLEKYIKLKNSPRMVVIGLFLVHFKTYREKPLMTIAEYDPNQHNGKDYKHYLIDRVKPILPGILKKHPIPFSY